jgi:RIO-like serine/threonine protein kinase
MVHLTDLMSTAQDVSDYVSMRTKFKRVFLAASILRREIRRDISTLLGANLPPLANPAFPSVNSATKFNHSHDHKVSFELESKVSNYEHRQVYLARHKSKTVVVKFTQRYCIELHQFCYERGHAPEIIAYDHLPGGWKVIVMEYIEDTPDSHIVDLARKKASQWRMELSKLIDAFHAEDWVHGDLRLANILFTKRSPHTPVLIDYDWAGKEGDAEYTVWTLNDELKKGRQYKDLKIRKEDDRRILESTLECLEEA